MRFRHMAFPENSRFLAVVGLEIVRPNGKVFYTVDYTKSPRVISRKLDIGAKGTMVRITLETFKGLPSAVITCQQGKLKLELPKFDFYSIYSDGSKRLVTSSAE